MDIESNLMPADGTILDAIGRLDVSHSKIILVVDERRRLLGTVTDGDIRRGVLRSLPLAVPVAEIMNRHPLVLVSGSESHRLLAEMQARRLRYVPVVAQDGTVLSIQTSAEVEKVLGRRDNLVVLMAGGLGTRLAPLTDQCPKPMLRVGDKPILEIILQRLIDSGFRRFCVSVNYLADVVVDYFGDGAAWGVEIEYLREKERSGTAGALALLPERPTRPFLVMNGDLLTRVDFGRLLDFHQEHRAAASMCVREYDLRVPYGTVAVEGVHAVRLEEKPVMRFFINAGIYCLDPVVFDHLSGQGWLDMPDLLDRLMRAEKPVVAFPIHEYWLDIGRMDDFKRAQNEYMDVFGD